MPSSRFVPLAEGLKSATRARGWFVGIAYVLFRFAAPGAADRVSAHHA